MKDLLQINDFNEVMNSVLSIPAELLGGVGGVSGKYVVARSATQTPVSACT